MEQRKIKYLLLFLVAAFFANAQTEKVRFVRKGLFRNTLTISPSTSGSIYLHGSIEYYVHQNLSVRSDGFYSLRAGQKYLTTNHSVFSGASYHFATKGNFDPYLFFQPGVAITQACNLFNYDCGTGSPQLFGKTAANPLISLGTGFNYYFQRWFHLFGELRYVYGKHIADVPPVISLNELRFSFGLGWNLNFIKS